MIRSSQLFSSLLCSSHPQLMKRLEQLRGYTHDLAVFVQKKSAREERSISLALGGARSSTPSLHHPGAGDVKVHCPGSLSHSAMCFKGEA